MSDKFRTTYPIALSFSAGELPDYRKLTSLSTQAKQGLNLLEYAIGDLWNQAGDPVFTGVSSAPLYISSLGRMVGSSTNLNPRIPTLPEIGFYKWAPEAGDLSQHEARLPFLPDPSLPAYAWSATSLFPLPHLPANLVASRSLVQASGDWYVNPDTGDFYSYNKILSTWRLSYKPVVRGDLGAATWNVIPDPEQSASYNFGGVKIYSQGGDNYTIWLPPRGPLGILSTSLASGPDSTVTDNFSSFPQSGVKTFWADSTVGAPGIPDDGAAFAAHYRYALPSLLTANWATNGPIPVGFLYLWDATTTGTIIEGITFTCVNSAAPYKFQASGAALTTWLANNATIYTPSMLADSTTHTHSHYPNTGLKVVTVGSSLSSAVYSLLGQHLNHDHSSSQGFIATRPVKHSALSYLTNSSETGLVPQLSSTSRNGDDHPQYLERHGLDAGRDVYQNGMLGDLWLASTNSGTSYDNLTADSNKLRFGSSSTGPVLNYSNALNGLQITTDTMQVSSAASADMVLSVFSQGSGSSGSATLGTNRISFIDEAWYAAITAAHSQEFLLHDTAATSFVAVGSSYISSSLGAEPTYPRGIYLNDSTATYQVKSRTDWITVSLGTGFVDNDGGTLNIWERWNSGFTSSIAPGGTPDNRWAWYSWLPAGIGGNSVVFLITDLPNYCTIDAIEFCYFSTSVDALQGSFFLQEYSDDGGVYDGTKGWLWGEGGTNLLGVGTYLTIPQTTKWEISTSPFNANTFIRGKNALSVQFSNLTASATIRAIIPIIRLQCTYTSVSPWQPIV